MGGAHSQRIILQVFEIARLEIEIFLRFTRCTDSGNQKIAYCAYKHKYYDSRLPVHGAVAVGMMRMRRWRWRALNDVYE